jgi:hypothetical protein
MLTASLDRLWRQWSGYNTKGTEYLSALAALTVVVIKANRWHITAEIKATGPSHIKKQSQAFPGIRFTRYR